jgi:D-beta-D-heptose 7-phosphate kinase/D-beta-D-heptose 1-phosphate adenosyltransferase
MMGLGQDREKASCCLVVGDIILDGYITGEVSRVSPEAPVPVIRVSERHHTLGGAANVAAGIGALGSRVLLAGVMGDDAGADVMRRLFAATEIAFKGIISADRATTEKTRLVGNGSQIARFDAEHIDALSNGDEARLLEAIVAVLGEVDIVVISDYNKGLCTAAVCRAVIEEAARRKIPVIVDPKQDDWGRYKGAFLIAPNLGEFDAAVKYTLKRSAKDMAADAHELRTSYDIENILITRSKEGMTLVNDSGAHDFGTKAKEVYDVSGAGDTVVAALAAFLAGGVKLNAAIDIANTAAGIAVGKSGTYIVTLRDLKSESEGKVVASGDIPLLVEDWRRQGKNIVFTNGCFDIIHAGHISLLKQSRQFGDVLIVGLNSDASVKRLKGAGRPINSEADRAVILSAFEAVDAVVLFDEDTPLELIKAIRPNVLVKGKDYTVETVVGADLVLANGGSVELVELVEEKSTSDIINTIMRKNQ